MASLIRPGGLTHRRCQAGLGCLLRPLPRCLISRQSTSKQLALKIEEYVPEMIPINIASTKSRVVVPPKTNKAVKVMITVTDV